MYYRAHVENYGWLGWTQNYAAAGTTNHNYRAEAIEILIVPAGTPAPGSTVSAQVFANNRAEARHLNYVNMLRLANGRQVVSSDPALKRVADARVRELPTLFSHRRPDGRTYETIVKDLYPNYNAAGGAILENINLARTTRMTDPFYSYDYMSSYPHQLELVLNPDAQYLAWSATTAGRMGYSIEVLSSLDRINFAD